MPAPGRRPRRIDVGLYRRGDHGGDYPDSRLSLRSDGASWHQGDHPASLRGSIFDPPLTSKDCVAFCRLTVTPDSNG